MFLSSYRNTIINQSARVVSLSYFLNYVIDIPGSAADGDTVNNKDDVIDSVTAESEDLDRDTVTSGAIESEKKGVLDEDNEGD